MTTAVALDKLDLVEAKVCVCDLRWWRTWVVCMYVCSLVSVGWDPWCACAVQQHKAADAHTQSVYPSMLSILQSTPSTPHPPIFMHPSK